MATTAFCYFSIKAWCYPFNIHLGIESTMADARLGSSTLTRFIQSIKINK